MQPLGIEFAQACARETDEEFDRMLVHVAATIRMSPRFARFRESEAHLLLKLFQTASKDEYRRAQAAFEAE